MPNQVAEAVKEDRRARVMAAQQRISLARNQAQVGRTLDVLVEAHGEMTARAGTERKIPVSLARSYRDAPEVDGLVVFPDRLAVGQMARVKVTGAMAYDLMGERVTRET
jgi:ribosomal protein S12 methylthiotransferase